MTSLFKNGRRTRQAARRALRGRLREAGFQFTGYIEEFGDRFQNEALVIRARLPTDDDATRGR